MMESNICEIRPMRKLSQFPLRAAKSDQSNGIQGIKARLEILRIDIDCIAVDAIRAASSNPSRHYLLVTLRVLV